jgi:hypothetical protein
MAQQVAVEDDVAGAFGPSGFLNRGMFDLDPELFPDAGGPSAMCLDGGQVITASPCRSKEVPITAAYLKQAAGRLVPVQPINLHWRWQSIEAGEMWIFRKVHGIRSRARGGIKHAAFALHRRVPILVEERAVGLFTTQKTSGCSFQEFHE